jgi:hypothetical protein
MLVRARLTMSWTPSDGEATNVGGGHRYLSVAIGEALARTTCASQDGGEGGTRLHIYTPGSIVKVA